MALIDPGKSNHEHRPLDRRMAGQGPSNAVRFLRDKKGTHARHDLLSLKGGTYLLESDEEWEQLYRALAEDVRKGLPNFLVQMKTPTYPAFMDLGERMLCLHASLSLHSSSL